MYLDKLGKTIEFQIHRLLESQSSMHEVLYVYFLHNILNRI